MYNSEFSTINTSDKAYVLGLYYADGYVSYNPDKRGYFSGIMLAIKDENLLLSICEKFPFFKICIDKNRPNAISIRCNQKRFLEDLIKNGCLPHKSKQNKNILKFPKIKPEYYPDFIRGYFDGDGSVINTNAFPNSKNCSIVSNNPILIRQIKYILYLNNIRSILRSKNWDDFGPNLIRGVEVNFTGICYTLSIASGKENLRKLSNFIYKHESLYLKRKHDIMINIKQTLTPRIPCPICKSLNTRKGGIKAKRIFCKECKKYVPLDHKPFVKMRNLDCKHCGSLNTVGCGKTRSRTNGEIISQKFICKDCNRESSYKTTAPDNSDIIRVQDQPHL